MMHPNVYIPKLRNHQENRLFIGGYPYLTAELEFSIKMIDTSMIAVEVGMFYFLTGLYLFINLAVL
jgi:hypothetical protein